MNFDDKTSFRIREEELKQINKAIKKHPGKYVNTSHFIRCAIIKELRKGDETNDK